jgi:hypothetical protein
VIAAVSGAGTCAGDSRQELPACDAVTFVLDSEFL